MPIEVTANQDVAYPTTGNSENDDNDEEQLDELQPEQYFYLKHHLLSDHENPDTYDGVIKQLTIRIPQTKQWQSKHLRSNMTSFYEQNAQAMYGKILGTPSNSRSFEFMLNKEGKAVHKNRYDIIPLNSEALDSSLSGNSSLLASTSEDLSQQQFVDRRIGGNANGASSKSALNNGGSYGADHNSSDEMNFEVSPDSEASTLSPDLHYEAQTAYTYSTALLVTIVVGCSLLVLNVLIFIGVYYQLDHKTTSQAELEVAAEADAALGASLNPTESSSVNSPFKHNDSSMLVDESNEQDIQVVCTNRGGNSRKRASNAHHQMVNSMTAGGKGGIKQIKSSICSNLDLLKQRSGSKPSHHSSPLANGNDGSSNCNYDPGGTGQPRYSFAANVSREWARTVFVRLDYFCIH